MGTFEPAMSNRLPKVKCLVDLGSRFGDVRNSQYKTRVCISRVILLVATYPFTSGSTHTNLGWIPELGLNPRYFHGLYFHPHVEDPHPMVPVVVSSRGISWGLIPLAFAERFSTLEQIRCASREPVMSQTTLLNKMAKWKIPSFIPSFHLLRWKNSWVVEWCVYIYIYVYTIYIYTYRSFGISFLGGATPEEHAHRSRSWVEPGWCISGHPGFPVVVGAYHWEARAQYNCRSFYIIPNRRYTQFHEPSLGTVYYWVYHMTVSHPKLSFQMSTATFCRCAACISNFSKLSPQFDS